MELPGKTTIGVKGDDFLINGALTYPGRTYRGMRIEGLLMNARLVQGIFDDRNPDTRCQWDYPDGPWDPQRNTEEFVAAMPAWREAGLLSFTINLQGGNPRGYGKSQPWWNSGFTPEGRLDEAYMSRLGRILDQADTLGMAPILGLFYFGQDERLKDEQAVLDGTDRAVDWLLERGYSNVLIEIANEVNVPRYEHEILRAERVGELIDRVRGRCEGRLLVSASMGGGRIPPESIVDAADFLLLHGNNVEQPDRIRQMVGECRALPEYRGQPIVFNEDDHFAFDADDNNMLAAVSKHASWGYFDYRMEGEGFEHGYQSPPVDWGIRSERKKAFFSLLREVTGGSVE